MPTGIDPRMFGQLEKSVDHLTKSVDTLASAVTDLTDRIGALEDRWKFGRGALIGVVLMAALSVYGASEFVDKLLGLVAK